MIGALHYETQVATAAAEQVGMEKLSAAAMTARGFVTICLLMSLCIMWGMVFSTLFNKRYLKRLGSGGGRSSGVSGFGDKAMTAMFIGLICAYIGSYVGGLVSGKGRFTFAGSWMPLAVALAASLAMAGFLWLAEKKKQTWVESFSIAGSMLLAMACAVLLGRL